MKPLYIINSHGEETPFSIRKVYGSARRAGASRSLAREISEVVEKESFPGIKTSEIFRMVRKMLSKKSPQSALKFPLKEAIRKLGPTGFPFEKYVGEIFFRNGFKVKLNQIIPGFCCRYEIDFLAKKGNTLYIGECKFHHLHGGKVDSSVALSNYARFLDIKKGNFIDGIKHSNIKSMLVTNTKFTSKAVRYSRCVGVELLGWRYPKKRGLEFLIESKKLYPITILPSLRRNLANLFVQRKMMLAQDLLRINIKIFDRKTGISLKRLEFLVKEARILLE